MHVKLGDLEKIVGDKFDSDALDFAINLEHGLGVFDASFTHS